MFHLLVYIFLHLCLASGNGTLTSNLDESRIALSGFVAELCEEAIVQGQLKCHSWKKNREFDPRKLAYWLPFVYNSVLSLSASPVVDETFCENLRSTDYYQERWALHLLWYPNISIFSGDFNKLALDKYIEVSFLTILNHIDRHGAPPRISSSNWMVEHISQLVMQSQDVLRSYVPIRVQSSPQRVYDQFFDDAVGMICKRFQGSLHVDCHHDECVTYDWNPSQSWMHMRLPVNDSSGVVSVRRAFASTLVSQSVLHIYAGDDAFCNAWATDLSRHIASSSLPVKAIVALDCPLSQLIVEVRRDIAGRVSLNVLAQSPMKPINITMIRQRMRRRQSDDHNEDDRQSPALMLLSDVYNEEMLIGNWIRHHAGVGDYAVLVDFNSSDRTADIIEREAPVHWRLVRTRLSRFQCAAADIELMDYEHEHPNAWKIVLTTAEYLVADGFRERLHQYDESDVNLIRFPSLLMVGNDDDDDDDDAVPFDSDVSLVCQRSVYAINASDPKQWFGINMYARFMHRQLPYYYGSGRHYIWLNGTLITDWNLDNEHADAMVNKVKFEVADWAFIAKYKWTPWPESTVRMLQISAQIDDVDKAVGTPHTYFSVDELQRARARVYASHARFDLAQLPWSSQVSNDDDDDDRLFALRRHVHEIYCRACHRLPHYVAGSVMLKGNDSRVFPVTVRLIVGDDGVLVDEVLHVSIDDVLDVTHAMNESALVRKASDFCAVKLQHPNHDHCVETVAKLIMQYALQKAT